MGNMFLALTVAALLGTASSASLPSYLMVCSRNDPNLNDCFEKAANDAIPKLKSAINMETHLAGPCVAHQIGNGISILCGISKKILCFNTAETSFPDASALAKTMSKHDYKIEPIEIFRQRDRCHLVSEPRVMMFKFQKLDLPNNLLSGKFLIPHARMESDYQVDGKVLLVPLKGKGKSKIDIWGTRAEFSLRVVPKEIRGDTYYALDALQYKIVGADGMKMKFTNLLGSNRALGESINDVLNENWRDLYDTVSPSFSEVLRTYFYDLGKRVFTRIPADQIFPEKV